MRAGGIVRVHEMLWDAAITKRREVVLSPDDHDGNHDTHNARQPRCRKIKVPDHREVHVEPVAREGQSTTARTSLDDNAASQQNDYRVIIAYDRPQQIILNDVSMHSPARYLSRLIANNRETAHQTGFSPQMPTVDKMAHCWPNFTLYLHPWLRDLGRKTRAGPHQNTQTERQFAFSKSSKCCCKAAFPRAA